MDSLTCKVLEVQLSEALAYNERMRAVAEAEKTADVARMGRPDKRKAYSFPQTVTLYHLSAETALELIRVLREHRGER